MGKMPKTPKSDQQQTAIKKGRSVRPFVIAARYLYPDPGKDLLTLIIQLTKASIQRVYPLQTRHLIGAIHIPTAGCIRYP